MSNPDLSAHKTPANITTTTANTTTITTSSNDSSAVSKKDKQMAAVLDLKNIASRLDDATNEITHLLKLIQDDNPSNRPIKSALSSMKSAILPHLVNSSDSIRNASIVLAPIGSINYVHNFEEKKRKSDAHDEMLNEKCGSTSLHE